ncbi:PD-(D/E)XK nuclease family protein [Bacteroidetes bacterium endosymbiont of Geopemphigus sp.]|uniref:PD-(D/E)XK nuclease family protein n=1 Tax=Bacteroidetes bacterium endosymbiont of Geopemphigus sp. TaxID=2047937 RepID=UPI000CD1CB80|nr:PD-(D/E)XK nuclease family protein [Bacteroidetes bacterium endosymbiont of Geopemphigus sp.]
MISFIDQLAQEIINKYTRSDALTLVLPGNRSIVQLKKALQKLRDEKHGLPEFFSMQTFMQRVSNLSLITTTSLLFESYKLAKKYTHSPTESFEKFLTWAPRILEDFNNLDLYMVKIDQFFFHMHSVEQMFEWSTQSTSCREGEKTPFWKPLGELYRALKTHLLSKGQAYQGLMYRQATEKTQTFLSDLPAEKHFIFAGMNALSKSEENVIEYLLDQKRAEVYWDIDEYFLDPVQEAGAFIQKYTKMWPSLQGKKLQWAGNDFKKPKYIEVTGVPSQIGQAKKAGIILGQLADKGHNFSRTAVVFPESSLVSPFLHSIPKGINKVTIGINESLEDTCWHQLFELIFRLFSNRENSEKEAFYYKDLLEIFSERHLRHFFHWESRELTERIYRGNLIFVPDALLKIYLKESFFLDILSPQNLNPKRCVEMLLRFIKEFNKKLSFPKETHDESSYLKTFEEFFQYLLSNASHLSSLHELRSLYKQWITSKPCSSSDEHAEGLQLLEIHETCLLDFDTVIITSVNEGVFPPEKADDSWIPFDTRLQMGLPVYRERDAQYAYYFYHLLQRAQHVFLIYNTQESTSGSGEKSRFIYQLDIESPHKLVHKIAAPLPDFPKASAFSIPKTPHMLERLRKMAAHGFSPFSLSLYIRDHVMFYKKKVLNLSEKEEVEESIEKISHGTLIHKSLEKLYRPLLNRHLSLRHCAELRTKITPVVTAFFRELYGESYQKGRNLLIYQVIKKQLEGFINWEENNLRNKQSVCVYSLEEAFSMRLDLPEEVRLFGKIDRIDECNGNIRIIDYKSGYVDPLSLRLTSDDLGKTVQDIRFDKALQLLLYACLYHSSDKALTYAVSPCIFSFRKIHNGLLPLLIDSQAHVNKDFIELFLPYLLEKVLEILDAEIPFTEKNIMID